MLSALNSPCDGLIVSTDYPAQHDVIIPDFITLLDEVGIDHEYWASRHRIRLPWAAVIFKTANKRIQGFQVSHAYIDEAAYCEDQAWYDVLARCSDKRAKKRQILATSTPEGRAGFFYKYFDPVSKDKLASAHLVQGTMYHNRRNLHVDYVAGVESAYTEKMKRAYILGQPCDFNFDQIFDSFDRDKHVATTWSVKMGYGTRDLLELDPSRDLIISCDFGRKIGSWSCSQIFEINGKTHLAVQDEIFQEGTHTNTMAQEFIDRYKGRIRSVEVHGDATGGDDRHTAVSVTDYEVLRKTLEPFFQVNIVTKARSPRHTDRYNIHNSALQGGPRFEMKISSKCHYLIEDHVECRYMGDGSRRPDKAQANGRYTHGTDQLGYLLCDLNAVPLREFNRVGQKSFPNELYSYGIRP